jgi:hypothetical protein
MPQLLERINFPKVVTVLAVTFAVSLGACGLTGIGIAKPDGGSDILVWLGFIELAVIFLSAFGLVLTAVVWIVGAALGKTEHRGSAPCVCSTTETTRDEEDKDRF